MAETNPKFLDSTITIEDTSYSITAAKLVNTLTITTMSNGEKQEVIFDGSKSETIVTGDADKVKVNNDFDLTGQPITDPNKIYGAITISASEPTGGTLGDIWFKY